MRGRARAENPGMRTRAKVGIVLAGYLLAVLAGILAGWAYDWRMSKMPYDTSGGMYAGGEMLAFLAAFLTVALVPTVLGLWFSRRSRVLWAATSVAALAFASVGLVSVLVMFTARGGPNDPVLISFGLLAITQLLGVPVWAVAFVLFTLIAPEGPSRQRLRVAVGLELVIGVCAAIHWLRPFTPF